MTAMTVGLQHVLFLSYHPGRLSVAGWFAPYSRESQDLPDISHLSDMLGRVHRNLQRAWEHLGEAEAAEEDGFVTGPRSSHLGATEDRQRCYSGHLWPWDSCSSAFSTRISLPLCQHGINREPTDYLAPL